MFSCMKPGKSIPSMLHITPNSLSGLFNKRYFRYFHTLVHSQFIYKNIQGVSRLLFSTVWNFHIIVKTDFHPGVSNSGRHRKNPFYYREFFYPISAHRNQSTVPPLSQKVFTIIIVVKTYQQLFTSCRYLVYCCQFI